MLARTHLALTLAMPHMAGAMDRFMPRRTTLNPPHDEAVAAKLRAERAERKRLNFEKRTK